jgi:hypothetical protein
MVPRKRLEEKVVNGISIEKIINLKKKELRKRYNSIPILEEYFLTKEGLKYIAVFNNGSKKIVSNVADYDESLSLDLIVNMFKERMKLYGI